jgi:hypothetical protein
MRRASKAEEHPANGTGPRDLIGSDEIRWPARPVLPHHQEYERTFLQGELRERLRRFFLDHAAPAPRTDGEG